VSFNSFQLGYLCIFRSWRQYIVRFFNWLAAGVNHYATAQAVVRNHQGGELTRDQKSLKKVCDRSNYLNSRGKESRETSFYRQRGIFAARPTKLKGDWLAVLFWQKR